MADHGLLLELINMNKIEELTQYFYQIVNIPFAISNPKGRIIVKTENFSHLTELQCHQEVCIKEGIKACRNDKDNPPIEKNGYVLFQCCHGLMNVAAPLYIDGDLVAYLFLTHFLTQRPNVEMLYKNMGRRMGHIESLLKIPVVDEKRIESIVIYLSKFTDILCESGANQIKSIRMQEELQGVKDEMEASFQQLAAAEAELMANYEILLKKEKDLRESDERYSLLFSSMNQGMAHHEIILDDQGQPYDYKYLGVNPSYEKMTDLKGANITGKTVREILPDLDEKWIKEYGEIALTGKSKEFESYVKRVDKYFKVFAYSPKHKEFAILVSDITEEKKLDRRLRKSLMEIVESFGYMIEKRDLYTAGHQKNVSKLAYKIGKHMGLSEDQLDGLYVAAVLHDIGKIGIPSEILTKPARLSPLEFNLIKTHPQNAYEILKSIDFQWPVADIVLQHHEKLDGSGYPYGLEKKDILLEARIITVADVVEAIASHRPYRPALGLKYAIEEITNNSGTFYDPDVVKICQEICIRDEDIFDIA